MPDPGPEGHDRVDDHATRDAGPTAGTRPGTPDSVVAEADFLMTRPMRRCPDTRFSP
jgi:hypothetical protein